MNTQLLGHKNRQHPAKLRGQRGIALVFTLLLLSMMLALSLAMAIAIGSQTLIAGFYKNYRGAFYAADSGVNIMRQAMLNQLKAAVPATVTTGTAPIPTTTAATILSNIQTTYAGWNNVNSSGSWPEQFELSSGTASFSLASCVVTWTGTGTGFTCTSLPTSPNVITGYSYTYAYSVTATGQVQNSEQQSITDSGNLIVNISISPASGATTLFSAWGMFIDQANECDGTTLVPGTISGPVFTNGGFTFTPSTYIFTDNVGFGDSQAGYSPTNGGACTDYAGSSYSDNVGGNKQTIAPQFNGASGLQLNQPAIKPPANDYSQSFAVLDGIGTGEDGVAAGTVPSAAPTNAQLNAALANPSGAYPSGGTSTGVFMPYVASGVNGCAPTAPATKCMSGGGIYVQGNATSATLTATSVTISGVVHPEQVFTIVQGGVTSTITEDMYANTTSFTSSGGTVNISGLPENLTPGNTPTPQTMLYVNGNIGSGNTGLSGPGSGNPAIQNNAEVTITAAGNITITGDILYKTEPVTTTQNQTVSYATSTCCNGDAADFLIPLPSTASTQVLGIFTAKGNVQLNNQQSSGNLEIDGSVAAISNGGSGGIVNTGNSINTLNIVGGRIQNTIQNIGATTRNVYFDRRFAQGTFGPPWFPSTTVTPANLSATTVHTVVQRLQWLNNSATMN
jgi:Tfp pilus assembly protein PilX